MILSMFPMTAFTIPEIICGIACTMVVMICGNAWIREISKSMPAWIIRGMASSTALIIPSIIWGIASTMAVMISGKAATKEVNSCIPVSIICGMESSKKVTMPLMISGRAAISTGRAFRIPCANPVIS